MDDHIKNNMSLDPLFRHISMLFSKCFSYLERVSADKSLSLVVNVSPVINL